jgi:hypothetical protein
MTTDSPQPSIPPVIPVLLADRNKRPVGLYLHCPDPATDTLLSWWADQELAELASRVACVWPDSKAVQANEALMQAIAAAGFERADRSTVLITTQVPPDSLPATVRWIGGLWFLHAPARATAAQAASRNRALQLLQMVNDDADTHELEEVFRQDAALSYQLLRLVNSVGMGARREISSFGQAILMLGRQQLKRWLNLLLFAARDDDPRSAMLMSHVTLRARGMELLSQAAGHDKATQDLAFMAGMLSMLDVLFGSPLVEVLQPLRISDALRGALIDREGELGRLLMAWEAVERGQDADLLTHLSHWQIPVADYNRLLVQACAWMFSLTQGPAGDAPRS